MNWTSEVVRRPGVTCKPRFCISRASPWFYSRLWLLRPHVAVTYTEQQCGTGLSMPFISVYVPMRPARQDDQ